MFAFANSTYIAHAICKWPRAICTLTRGLEVSASDSMCRAVQELRTRTLFGIVLALNASRNEPRISQAKSLAIVAAARGATGNELADLASRDVFVGDRLPGLGVCVRGRLRARVRQSVDRLLATTQSQPARVCEWNGLACSAAVLLNSRAAHDRTDRHRHAVVIRLSPGGFAAARMVLVSIVH